MSPLDPLNPGDLRIRIPASQSRQPFGHTRPPSYRGPRHHSGGIAGPLICMLIIFMVKWCDMGGGGGYSGGSGTGSSYSSPYTQSGLPGSMGPWLPIAPPVLPGRYAAIIRHERRDTEAIVFTYAKVKVITVESLSDIPQSEKSIARSYPSSVSAGKNSKRRPSADQSDPDQISQSNGALNLPPAEQRVSLFKHDTSPLSHDHFNYNLPPQHRIGEQHLELDDAQRIALEDLIKRSEAARPKVGDNWTLDLHNPQQPTDQDIINYIVKRDAARRAAGGDFSTPRQRPPPRIIHGDVIVETGPIVDDDELKTQLIARHGNLKEASIDIIDGSPRGPPNKAEFLSRPVITIYVVGKILRFSGPQQMGNSLLKASIIDLGPTDKQFSKYERDVKLHQLQAKAEFERMTGRPGFSPLDPLHEDYRREPYDTTPKYERPEYHPIEGIP
jgi:hypothetical protein